MLFLERPDVAKRLVNLDALIPREDFEISDVPSSIVPPGPGLNVGELEHRKITYSLLRKPDFQRETAEWTVDKVVDLIRSFLDGDLIPALILWRSPVSGNFFVIDGAHRLSALIAWVQDDYGDGKVSREFFSNVVTQDQVNAAVECREAVLKGIGTYAELTTTVHIQGNAPPDKIRRAKNLATFPVQLQWVPGDAKQAEASFFKINQKATPISQVELLLLQSRRMPNAIASRALIRSGVGHKYWSSFPSETQLEIEAIAREVYEMLFVPELETPIKTLDLPIAGRGYSSESVRLIFDFVNLANGVALRPKRLIALPEDSDGSQTVKFLRNVRRLAQQVSGPHASSLGLHPAVYFYGATARYQPSAFLATVSFVDSLVTKNQLPDFTAARAGLEDFLVAHAYFINQLVGEYGTTITVTTSLTQMLRTIFEGILRHNDAAAIIAALKAQPALEILSTLSDEERVRGKNFSSETKSRVFMREAINKAPLCAICGARMHVNTITLDHKKAKRDGGVGSVGNAQLAHPYCNSARDVLLPRISAFRSAMKV